ncbi:thioesterase family protein [Desulforegula conservatrix]|uniref:thioesterase family protein n=1 Tax=Desulforegula conservatrix TaxID=153026 RepID=UPI0003F9536C|nr:thioesterase family protein [Desulforegula conservatrix]
MNIDTTLLNILPVLKSVYEKKMPFNKHIGLKIDTLTPDETIMRIDMDSHLIGNYSKNVLHGGVLSSIIDVTGGLMASVELLKRIAGSTPEEIAKRLGGMATIDMRVDFLRPGKGSFFLAKGKVIRCGARIALIQIDVFADNETHVATGLANYKL